MVCCRDRITAARRRCIRRLFLLLIPILLVTASPSFASDPPLLLGQNIEPIESSETDISNEVDGYPVTLDGELIFQIRQGVPGVTTAEERANIIKQRILVVANNPDISIEDIRADVGDVQSVVRANDTVLLTINELDAEIYDDPHPVLAQLAVDRIQTRLQEYREKRSVQSLVRNLIATIVSTIVLLLFLRSLFLITSKSLLRIKTQQQAGTLRLQIRSFQILGANASSYLLSNLIRLLRVVLILIALYLYVPFVLSQFPATEALGDSLLKDIAFRLNSLAQAFVAYLPNLAMIGVIAIIAYFAIQFAEQVITELGRPGVYPWFYEEWVKPTIRLVSLSIVAIAFVMAGPYLPGFGSPAFQGISIFVGALLTLGSSSAVSNALSGLILIYTRAFQLGDFIRIDSVLGEVKEKSLFVTRVLTPKQETVTIPNASVLNNNVINYSAICRESRGHLLLYTTITLGYDVPWRDIYTTLIDAAKVTTYVESKPCPFVQQIALNDFNVSYQLNVYTSAPNQMLSIYSELHQNIQDKCNEANIEILSPHFSALRDGNHSTIPANYLPSDYASPGFVVQNPDGHSS